MSIKNMFRELEVKSAIAETPFAALGELSRSS
jgi:hypothetical protein